MKGKACGGKMSKGYAAGGKTNMQMLKMGRGLAKVANQKKTGSRRGG
jgi:hypothetical protein